MLLQELNFVNKSKIFFLALTNLALNLINLATFSISKSCHYFYSIYHLFYSVVSSSFIYLEHQQNKAIYCTKQTHTNIALKSNEIMENLKNKAV